MQRFSTPLAHHRFPSCATIIGHASGIRPGDLAVVGGRGAFDSLDKAFEFLLLGSSVALLIGILEFR